MLYLIYIDADDAEKSPVSDMGPYAWNNICTVRREYLTESIGVVSAKYPSKVKLELLTTLEC